MRGTENIQTYHLKEKIKWKKNNHQHQNHHHIFFHLLRQRRVIGLSVVMITIVIKVMITVMVCGYRPFCSFLQISLHVCGAILLFKSILHILQISLYVC